MTRLLTARELAERLGVSTETTLRWTRRGALPAIRLPSGAVRFDEDAIDAWMVARATPTPQLTLIHSADDGRQEGSS
jgi:excisionase family DNA binding protein